MTLPPNDPSLTLNDASLFLNRELSMLEFQRRVLEEAQDDTNPLLERVKFLAIFGSNMDEFFMVRVSGIRKQVEAHILDVSVDGMTPREELAAIRPGECPAKERRTNVSDVRVAGRARGVPGANGSCQ